MKWHGSCYACTCTASPHNQSQFARIPPGARAKGRTAGSLPCRPATNHYRQHASTRGRNRAVFLEMGRLARASMPADGRWGGLFRTLHDLPVLGRRLSAGGPFWLRGHANARLAIDHYARQDLLCEFVQALPRHFKISVPFAHDHEAKGVGNDQEHIGASQNVDC